MALIKGFIAAGFLFRNLKEKYKTIESSKVDRAYVTHCSNSHFLFPVGMVYLLKLFRARPSRLLKK